MGKLFTLICLVIMSKYAMGYDYYYGYQPPTYTTGAPVYGSVPVPAVPVVPPVYSSYNLGSGVTQYDVPTVSPGGYSGSQSVVCVTTANVTVCN